MKNPAPPSALSPEEMPGPAARLSISQELYEATSPLEEPSPAATLTISMEPQKTSAEQREGRRRRDTPLARS